MTELKVLVVDDEEEFVQRLVERLKMRGLDVEGVTTGEDALDAVERRCFDVVLLDVRLPGIDGVQVLQRLKQRQYDAEVVILTGYADAQVAVRVMELGAFDYLVKPIKFDNLLYRIQDASEKKRLRGRKGSGEEVT